MIIAGIANTLLGGSLLPEAQPHQHAFARVSLGEAEAYASYQRYTTASQMQALQVNLLIAQPIVSDHTRRLSCTNEGAKVTAEVAKTALKWWAELQAGYGDMNGDEDDGARRNSLFTAGGSMQDEGVELSVAVLVSPSWRPLG